VAVASAGPYANHLQLAADSNHASTASTHLFTGQMLFLMPNQHCQSTEGNPQEYKRKHAKPRSVESSRWTGTVVRHVCSHSKPNRQFS